MKDRISLRFDKPLRKTPPIVPSAPVIPRFILLISTPRDLPQYQALLQDGSKWGVHISYAVQPSPDGLAQAFILGEEFIDGEDVALILGDNIFFGHGLVELLRNSIQTVNSKRDSVVFGYAVKNPERYGVVGFGNDGKVASISEKPDSPVSNYAVVGLYFYTHDVVDSGWVVPFCWSRYGYQDNCFNFGQGWAWLDNSTSTIKASSSTDEDGYGKFRYSPPSGFYAICSKNLAEYG